MRKINIAISVIIPCSIFIVLFQSCSTTIDLSQYPIPELAKKNYPINKEIDLSISIVETGFAKTSEAFVYKGGSLFKTRKLSHIAVLIQHPKGNFVFDTGLGSEIEAQLHENFSFIDRQLFKFTKLQTLRESLASNDFPPDSLDFIIPTHLHFDHASGIEDFPNAFVWTSQDEYDHAFSEEANAPAFIKEQYDADFIKWKMFDFQAKPYEVFEESLDLFGDRTIVIVKLKGHTKGSIGLFANLPSGKRYFFTGDLSWAAEAFIGPSEKHTFSRQKVDTHREQVKESLVKVHHLMKLRPEIIIVPAHDTKAHKEIAYFPEVER